LKEVGDPVGDKG